MKLKSNRLKCVVGPEISDLKSMASLMYKRSFDQGCVATTGSVPAKKDARQAVPCRALAGLAARAPYGHQRGARAASRCVASQTNPTRPSAHALPPPPPCRYMIDTELQRDIWVG